MNYIKHIIIVFFICTSYINAQELLTKAEAVKLALNNNYGIKIANNNVKLAENNSSIYNSGYLPTVNSSASTTLSNTTSELTKQDNSVIKINDAEAKNYSASLNLNYVLFDGMGRKYSYDKLKENYNLSKLEAQAVIESTLLQLFNAYFEVARLTEQQTILKESLEISKNRLKRTQYGFNYGQNTKLAVLNAEVDVNNDSIQLINTERVLNNAKRNLNLILGRNVSTIFEVNTDIIFENFFELNSILEKAKKQNVEMQKVQKNLELAKFDIKINKSNLFPTLSLNGTYNWNKADNDATFNYTEQFTKGLNAGLSLNWNIFDGGLTKTRIKNAKIASENVQIQKELYENELELNVSNALEIYNNAIIVLNAEEKNVETNQRNFDRTNEQFKLGQITSIELRQAQLNLLNSKSNLNQAKFEAKNAELNLLMLTGDLLNTNF